MTGFIERYFTAASQEESGFAYFPEIVWVMGQCSAARCTAPTRYLWIHDCAYVPTCEGHACDLAAIVNDHKMCPKCNMHFTEPPNTLVTSAIRRRPNITENFTGAKVTGPSDIKKMMDEMNRSLARVKPEE